MSHVNIMRVLLISLFVVMATGCGDPNTEGPSFDADSGSHVATWIYSHVDPAHTRTSQCTECHGEDFNGGISGVSCDSCHTEGDPLTTPNCLSCHSAPPSTGAHEKHNALANVTGLCKTCHNGAGSGTLNHYNQSVQVAFLPEYNSKSGIAAYDSATQTCSNVSCHGGPRTQTPTSSVPTADPPQSARSQTPNWFTGTIPSLDPPDFTHWSVVDIYCTECHVYGTEEFNSYSSGKHFEHVFFLNPHTNDWAVNYVCEACHNLNLLPNSHFKDLNTPGIPEGAARDTLVKKITDGYVYNSDTGKWTCTNSGAGCHGSSTREW